jgi:hypothetical protein
MAAQPRQAEADLRPRSDESAPRRWLAVALLLGLLLVPIVLCGGLFYMLQPHVTDDPAAVAPLTRQLLTVEVPPVFTARGTIAWNVAFAMSMRAAYYDYTPVGTASAGTPAADADGELVFVGVDHTFQDKPDVKRHVEQVLQQKGAGTQELLLEGVESRTVPINGEPCAFEFETRSAPAVRNRPKVSYRVIHGVVTGRSGPVLIVLRVPLDGNWDDAIAERMLASIR